MNILYQYPVLSAIVEELTLFDLLQLSSTCKTAINPDVLSLLISQLKTVDSQTLIKYLENSKINIAIVKGLLKNPLLVNPLDNDNEPFLMASEDGHVEVVRLLLADPRIDPYEDNGAIYFGSENGHVEIVRLLLTCRFAL